MELAFMGWPRFHFPASGRADAGHDRIQQNFVRGGKPSMANHIRILGQKVRKGGRMTMGTGWKLVMEKGRERGFSGTLLATFNLGRRRIAVFNVPK